MKSRLRSIPFLLYLHLFLTGLAVSVIAFINLRQYSLVIGEHMISLCILLAAFLLNIAFGSRFFGKRSDRISNMTRFVILLELGLALYALANPSLVNAFEKISDMLVRYSGAGLYRIYVYRFVLLLVFLLPVTFAGALMPVFSKYMIRHVSHIGRKSGAVFALISMGTATGIGITGFFAIQRYGYAVTLVISAALLLVNTSLLMLYQKRKSGAPADYPYWSMAMKARKSGMTVLKTSFVLDAEAKLIRTLLWVFAIQGFATMSFAILWSRTLSGLLRTDVSGTLSATALAVFSGLTVGSLLFKKLADRPRKHFYLLGLIEMLTGIAAAFSFVALFLLLSKDNQDFLSAILLAGGLSVPAVLAGVLILLPALFTGASFPISCRLYPKRIQRIGRRIGWLGFVFLIGAAFSLFLTNFILIPLLGVYTAFFLFVIVTILIGLILFLRDSRLKRLFRLAILLVSIALIILLQSLFKPQNYTIHSPELGQQDTILVRREGSTASVLLVQRAEGYSDLMINGNTVLQSDEENIKVQQLLAFLPQLFSGGTRSAYVGGFGLGVTASSMEMCGFSRINITEKSPEVIALASSAFADLNNDILTNQAVTITIEDSRSFLHRTDELYDVITLTYTHPLTDPIHYSREFYALCLERLEENGMMCQTLPASWFGSSLFRSVLRSCTEVFNDVSLWYTGTDKVLLLASREIPSRDFCELKERFDRLNSDQKMSRIGLPGPEVLLSYLMYDDMHIRDMSHDYPEITDSHPLRTKKLQEGTSDAAQPEDFTGIEGVSYSDWLDLSGNCVYSESYTLNIIESYKKIILSTAEN